MRDIKKLLKEAVAEGWSCEQTNRHYKLRHPSGALVVVSGSASDRRAILNVRADLRRALRRARP